MDEKIDFSKAAQPPEDNGDQTLRCGCQARILIHTNLDLFQPMGVDVGMRISQCETCKQILSFDLVVPPDQPQIHLAN